jgi:hypothetical protein
LALSLFLTSAFLLAPVFTEQVIHPVAGTNTSSHSWWRIDSDRTVSSHWYRLLTAPNSTVWLNGARLIAGERGVYDVSSLRGKNLIIVHPPARVWLSVTPRVFISQYQVNRNAASVQMSVTIRNTLENTVNAGLSVAGIETLAEAPATVPPGVSETVHLSFPFARGQGSPAVTLRLEKDGEAMEGSYRFDVPVRLTK